MNIVFILIGILVVLVVMGMGIYNKYIRLKNLTPSRKTQTKRKRSNHVRL